MTDDLHTTPVGGISRRQQTAQQHKMNAARKGAPKPPETTAVVVQRPHDNEPMHLEAVEVTEHPDGYIAVRLADGTRHIFDAEHVEIVE